MKFLTNVASLTALNRYFRRYSGRLAAGIVFIVAANLFKVVPAQVVRHAFDLIKDSLLPYAASAETGLYQATKAYFVEILVFFAVVIIGFAVLNGIFTFLMRQTIIVMSRKIEFDLKNDIYSRLQRLPLGFYKMNNTGDLMARVTEDVGRVRMYVGPAIMYSINLVVLIVIVITIMLSVSPRLTLFVLLPLPVLAVSIYYVNNLTFIKSLGIQEQLSRLTTFVQETFSGIRVVKSFSKEKSVEERFDAEIEDYRARSLNLIKIDAAFYPLILLLIGLSMLITLYVGGREVLAGRITPGVLAEFFIYVNLLSWPVASIGWTTSLIQRAAASQRRINELLAQPMEQGFANTEEPGNFDIAFENVSFTYPDTGIKVLEDVSFSIPQGTSLGIIGPTGSGKSSIAALIFRAYDPQKGRICVGGKGLNSISLEHYRSKLGYVPQDTFLFSDTIANNFFFALDQQQMPPGEREQLLRTYARQADVLKDIELFPDGFETMLGERGVTLSGGQKQRVSIGRALAAQPEVLILDDSFSAIDTSTEAAILANLQEMMKGRTTVLISHRVSTVRQADYIIVLENGRIGQQGTHQQLAEQPGFYRNVYLAQALAAENPAGKP